MTRLLITFVLLYFLVGCSESNKNAQEEQELIKSLVGTTWESTECKPYYFNAYTKHFFIVTESELTFYYQYYDTDCVELLLEDIERRPFTVGQEFVTSSGMVATRIDVEKILTPPDGNYIVKDLLYMANNKLYFSEPVKEEGCEAGNERIDIQSPIITIYFCDQIPTELDFENYYTKKI